MCDTVSSAELDGQHAELLPARTVLSTFSATDGGAATDGAHGVGTIGVTMLGRELLPGGGNGTGAAGQSANG